MCVNQKWIKNKYNGHTYFVKCGHCTACLQEKAIRRANRIRSNLNKFGLPKYDVLFVTLTYHNDFIPYIDRNLVAAYLCNYAPVIPVHRDCKARYISSFENGSYFSKVYSPSVIGEVAPDFNMFECESHLNNLSQMTGLMTKIGIDSFLCDDSRIGVLWLPDIQNFIKRLKVNLVRNFDYEGSFRYCYTGELGPTTLRPHFHLLIYVDRGWFSRTVEACRKSWSYDCLSEKTIQRAIKPEGYLSSYVNSDSTLPLFFRDVKEFSPFYHTSQNFGFGEENFSLSSLYGKFQEGDFTFPTYSVKDGVLTRSDVPIPCYVLNRYFRKFKGFSKLTSDQIQYIAERPQRISSFARYLELEVGESRSISNFLIGLKKRYYENVDYSPEKMLPFPFVYSRIWQRYNAFKLKFLHKDVDSCSDIIQLYDNIDSYLSGSVENSLLDSIVADRFVLEWQIDPNKFRNNLNRHSTLTLAYQSYSKDKKKRNYIYRNVMHV